VSRAAASADRGEGARSRPTDSRRPEAGGKPDDTGAKADVRVDSLFVQGEKRSGLVASDFKTVLVANPAPCPSLYVRQGKWGGQDAFSPMVFPEGRPEPRSTASARSQALHLGEQGERWSGRLGVEAVFEMDALAETEKGAMCHAEPQPQSSQQGQEESKEELKQEEPEEVIRALLAHEGVGVNQADEDGLSPLGAAVGEGDIEVVQELLAQLGVAVNWTLPWTRDTRRSPPYFTVLRAAGAREREESEEESGSDEDQREGSGDGGGEGGGGGAPRRRD